MREKPLSIYPEIDIQGRFLSYDKLNSDEINRYKLSLFNPSKYVQEKFKDVYTATIPTHDPFTQADRETFLIGMMKVNFLKRLESSVKSFEITMGRTIAKIEALEKKINDYLQSCQKPESDDVELDLDLGDSEEDEDLEEAMLVGGKFKYSLGHLELDCGKNWLKDLKKDKDQLTGLFKAAQNDHGRNGRQTRRAQATHCRQGSAPHRRQAWSRKQEGSCLHRICRHRHLSL